MTRLMKKKDIYNLFPTGIVDKGDHAETTWMIPESTYYRHATPEESRIINMIYNQLED